MILHGDCLVTLPTIAPKSVQTCVTSPPYYGLRDYGVDGQIGLEQTPEEYIAKMVQVFRLVRDALKDDGTLWLNLGDSYWGGKGASGQAWSTEHTDRDTLQKPYHQISGKGETRPTDGKHEIYKPKDLLMIPARVALALQADGWYLRSEIIWHKPNPMPESVRDRPTKAHEMIYLLAKSQKYYYDADAVKEKSRIGDPEVLKRNPQARQTLRNLENGRIATSDDMGYYYKGERKNGKARNSIGRGERCLSQGPTRNRRDVWTVTTKPYKGAHFATFPPDLIEPCILAGSRKGDIVLDPFNGSGTTGAVALKHGREYIGCELNEDYIKLTHERLAKVQVTL